MKPPNRDVAIIVFSSSEHTCINREGHCQLRNELY